MNRQSNIELCRLVYILCVLLVQTTSISLGSNIGFGVNLLESFTVIGVDVFVLITGFFSITPKKSSLFNLVIICAYWMIIKILCHYITDSLSVSDFLPVKMSNWFITSYIVLYFFAPMLNLWSVNANRKSLLEG